MEVYLLYSPLFITGDWDSGEEKYKKSRQYLRMEFRFR